MEKFKKPRGVFPFTIAVFSMEKENFPVALQRLVGPIQTMEKSGILKLDFFSAQKRDLKLSRLIDADLVVIHREFGQRKHCQKILEFANSLSIPVVFEVDDLLFNLPESHPNWRYFETIRPDLIETIKSVDYITVSTDELKAEIRKIKTDSDDNIFVLPSCIDTKIWGGDNPISDRGDGPFIIGWSGTPTHENDLEIVVPAIKSILKRHPGEIEFKFWGFLPNALQGIPGITLERGLIPNFIQHAHEMRSSKIHLAIAPLADNIFNRCKTNVKWMEYSICRIPGIYSRVSPYMKVDHGKTGWLVDHRWENWMEAIETFVLDEDLRKQIAEQAHQEIIEKHLLSRGAPGWAEIYEKIFLQFRISHPPISPVQREKAKYQLLLEEGTQLLACEKFSQAIKDFEASVALEPASQEAQNALIRAKNTFEASKALKTADELRKKKLFTEAAQQSARAVALSPTWTKAICSHAQLLSNSHCHLEAAKYYQLVVKEVPLDWRLRVKLSDEYRLAGLIDTAKQEFMKARLFAYESNEIKKRESILNIHRDQKRFDLSKIYTLIAKLTTSPDYERILQEGIRDLGSIDEFVPALQVFLEIALSKKDEEMSKKISEVMKYIQSASSPVVKTPTPLPPSPEIILENILNGSDLVEELEAYKQYFSQDLLELIRSNSNQAQINGNSELVEGLETLRTIIADAMNTLEDKKEINIQEKNR